MILKSIKPTRSPHQADVEILEMLNQDREIHVYNRNKEVREIFWKYCPDNYRLRRLLHIQIIHMKKWSHLSMMLQEATPTKRKNI